MLVWSWRSVATTSLVLAAVFATGLVVGFLLEHEPAPDDRHISITHPLQPPPTETRIAGEVTQAGDGRIELQTLGGVVGLDLGPGMSIEELIRVTDARFVPGDAVNLGGEQGDFGIVLTGVVAVEPANNAEASR